MNAPAPLRRSDTDGDALLDRFRAEVLAGLSQPRKAIPARWFYDRRGSELFEAITGLPEYYPTRTEIDILSRCCRAVADITGAGRTVVEFGAGSAAKTPLLLDAIDPAAYVPVDISGQFLRQTCSGLKSRYPRLPVLPVEADFIRPVPLPVQAQTGLKLGFFPGSTIGNLEPAEATDLLRSMRDTLGPAGMLLLGMDLIKDEATLLSAYDDPQGITAAFNANVAVRINRELAGTLPLDALAHKVVWNEPLARIEMHLAAVRAIGFEVCGREFSMAEGETIHTENSHKYSRRSADLLLRAGGWHPLASYLDQAERFVVILAGAISAEVTA